MGDENYYDTHSSEYAQETGSLDLSHIYNKFVIHLPKNSQILDLGCGAGRDTLHFMNLGYQVTPVDSSQKMREYTEKLTGLKVMQINFLDMIWSSKFDGVWASASLLHCSRVELDLILPKIYQALNLGGIFYCSFKYGSFSGLRAGRYFTDLTEDSLNDLIVKNSSYKILEIWKSQDLRACRSAETWLNALLIKN